MYFIAKRYKIAKVAKINVEDALNGYMLWKMIQNE